MEQEKPVRVLIIDDSATMRRLIRTALEADGRLVVAGEAENPIEAREMIKRLAPDVLTLDVEMPRMNGLEFLERLMRLRPMPVVMVSTLTQRGSRAAIEALALGAVDCIGKPAVGGTGGALSEIADRVVAAAAARVRPAWQGQTRAVPPSGHFRPNGRFVLIGASTGGVEALETVLSGLPANCAPVLVTQHMPEAFLASFAARLNGRVAPQVLLAADGMPVRPGHVFLAPGGATHLVLRPGSELRCGLLAGEKVSGHRPSVDMLFRSAVPLARRCIAVMLTGMGRDGAEAMRHLRAEGATCIAQDEETSVVFGMPRAALENGAAERAVALHAVAGEIVALTRSRGEPGPGEFAA